MVIMYKVCEFVVDNNEDGFCSIGVVFNGRFFYFRLEVGVVVVEGCIIVLGWGKGVVFKVGFFVYVGIVDYKRLLELLVYFSFEDSVFSQVGFVVDVYVLCSVNSDVEYC